MSRRHRVQPCAHPDTHVACVDCGEPCAPRSPHAPGSPFARELFSYRRRGAAASRPVAAGGASKCSGQGKGSKSETRTAKRARTQPRSQSPVPHAAANKHNRDAGREADDVEYDSDDDMQQSAPSRAFDDGFGTDYSAQPIAAAASRYRPIPHVALDDPQRMPPLTPVGAHLAPEKWDIEEGSDGKNNSDGPSILRTASLCPCPATCSDQTCATTLVIGFGTRTSWPIPPTA